MLLALLGREVPEMPAAWVFSPQHDKRGDPPP